MTDFYKDFGKVIREYRKNKHYTQLELANSMNISVRSLRDYESGTHRIGLIKALEICKFLGIDLNRLMERYV